MANESVLGLFHEATPTADAIDAVRKLGVAEERITVLSSIPYRAQMLGRPREARPVGRIALLGALIGLALGLFLSVGIFLLYPLVQGGQPIVPIPPMLIILFETTMLGTMWATFIGLLAENRFPAIKPRIYDPRITEGHIGVAVDVDEALAGRVATVLEEHGAHHLRREPLDLSLDRARIRFWAVVLGGTALLSLLVVLVSYNVIDISFPTNMADQASIAYLEGPRYAAPESAVPIQGPVLIDGQPASEPVAASPDSLQRGAILFDINCKMCHGANGDGQGTLRNFFSPHPADLTGEEVNNLSDDGIFTVIIQGRDLMPPQAEGLSVEESWDIVNYVRQMQHANGG